MNFYIGFLFKAGTMHLQFSIFLVLCLVGLAIRTTYEVLKKQGKLDPRNKTIFGIVFTGMCLMLISWPFLGSSDPWRVNLPAGIRWMGIAFVVVGLVIAVGALLQLRGLENIDHLESGGFFAKLRHPMYTGFILFILGWVIYFGALASLIVGCVAIINILYWRHLEEIKMLSDYGEVYQQYRKQTWF
jgi:protein-S-isoprenylcysteine O-methyltransferase Ste14